MADPYCLAMLLCDAIHQDPATGKHTLLGTFSTVTAAQFPAHIQLCVYFAVTDGQGKVPLKLRIVDSEADIAGNAAAPVIETSDIEVDFPDPLMVCESIARVVVMLPKKGVYFCELYSGATLLMARRLLALDMTEEIERNE